MMTPINNQGQMLVPVSDIDQNGLELVKIYPFVAAAVEAIQVNCNKENKKQKRSKSTRTHTVPFYWCTLNREMEYSPSRSVIA